MVLKDKKYVVGICEFGKTEPEQYPTNILYKANGEIRCGFSNTATDKRRRDEGDIYIDNIKQYILNKDQANEELEQMLKGLTIKKVVSDYLKIFHAVAIERLGKQEDFCNSYNFEQDFKLENLSYCLSCPTSLNDFFADCFVEAGIAEKDNLVFVSKAEATAFHCISLGRQTTKIVPNQTYLVFDIGHSSFGVSKIKADSTENFSEVELVSEELGKGSMVLEDNFRDFLIENKSHLNLNESIISRLVETFVKEIKFSFDFSQVGYNEDASDDYDEDDYDEDDFDQEDDKSDKDLVFTLRENSTNEEDFEEENSYEQNLDYEDSPEEIIPFPGITNFSGGPINITMDDLEKRVFSPYIDYIVNYIMNVYQEDTRESKIFLSGKYCTDANFYEKLSSQNDGKFEQCISLIEDTDGNAVSLGAVSFGLKIKNVQIPFFGYANSYPASPEPQKNMGSSEKFKTEHESKEFDFIVGIDFGTTFTGCSYANPRDVQVNDNNAIHDIKARWPGGDAVAYGKVPTLIMYDKKMKTKFWGQEAKQNARSYKDLNLLSNFKCFPYPETVEAQYGVENQETTTIKEANSYIFNSFINTSQTPHKDKKYSVAKRIDSLQVCSDYLKEVKEHVIRRIIAETKFKKSKKGFNLFSKSSENQPRIQFILTVPDHWTKFARESMVKIAIKATIIKEDELDDLLIISELEAAALFFEKYYLDGIQNPEHPDDDPNFIVCDAGAQTVDLATFHRTHNQENGDAMIYQIGNSIGDTCGSAYLDKAFKDYLLNFYEDIGIELENNKIIDSVMENFDFSIKHNFRPDFSRDGYYVIELPVDIRITSMLDTQAAKKYNLIEKNTRLKIKHTEIKEKLFDPIIKRILILIQRQLDEAHKRQSTIKFIVLVGGFFRNPYLQQRIQDEFRGYYDVRFPEEGAAAVSRGAVSYGLKPRLISGKRASRSIALEVRTPLENSKGDLLKKRVDLLSTKLHHEAYSKNRLEYFVRQSDNLEGLFHRTVTVDYPNNALIAVFGCDFKEEDDKENWRYVSKRHTKILEELIKLPEVEEIKKDCPIQFNVSLEMNDIVATVTIECRNRLINGKIKEITNGYKTSLKVVRKCDLTSVKSRKHWQYK
ncbi:hypothetical protein MFLAVUS_003596 [Mucor flavus]|uniref:Uncharacterized protein n=1 Tax=Mucor flavus TaxID=439312 RepID=A0ABP9YTI5_9FUNG